MNRDEINKLSKKIIGIAISIHKKLGPGFMEKIYEKALAYEFKSQVIEFVEQKIIKVTYKDVELGEQRADFLVEDQIILELKSVSEINNIHKAQMLSYLKTADKRLGLILNFAKEKLDIKRLVNQF